MEGILKDDSCKGCGSGAPSVTPSSPPLPLPLSPLRWLLLGGGGEGPEEEEEEIPDGPPRGGYGILWGKCQPGGDGRAEYTPGGNRGGGEEVEVEVDVVE